MPIQNKREIDWQEELYSNAMLELSKSNYWQSYLEKNSPTIHLGIFQQPFLDYVLTKKKTVESRFSSVLCPPHGRVKKGDVLLLKGTGAPVSGVCKVDHVWFYELDPKTFSLLRKEFSEVLCAQDPEFWKSRKSAKYATLMKISKPTEIAHLECRKKDRRGWVILQGKQQGELDL